MKNNNLWLCEIIFSYSQIKAVGAVNGSSPLPSFGERLPKVAILLLIKLIYGGNYMNFLTFWHLFNDATDY